MPLARILTLRPEEATGLLDQLQQLGFEVEISSPHERDLEVADLEIEFAICDQQEVLGRASAIAAQLQANVIVFPGALPPPPRRPVIEEAPVLPPEPVVIQAPSQHVEEPELEPALPMAVEDSGQQIERRAWSARFAEGLRKSRRQFASAAGVAGAKMRGGLLRLKPIVTSAMVKFRITTSAAGNAVADRTREYQERMKQRAAQAQAARTKRLAEMERARLEAREQVATLERARMAAEAQHQQLQRLDAELPDQQRKPVKPQSLHLRGVFAGAAAAAALFIVGMLLANFHARAPLPPSMSEGSVQQNLPFGSATVHGPPGVTLAPTTPAAPVAATKSAPLAVKASPSAPGPQPATQRTRTDSGWHHFGKNSTGEDVVVRHFGQPRKPTTQTAQQQQPGIRRYSDQ